MKEATIKVLKVAPHLPPEVAQLENELHALQEAVSIGAEERGSIELCCLEPGVSLLCNEEGKWLGLEANRRMGWDIIVGTFYIVGIDASGAELCSLPEDRIAEYMERYKEPEDISNEEVAATYDC